MEQDIRKKIDLLVKMSDKSISQVSEDINLSRQTLYRFLGGESDMRFSYLVALLKELGIDLNEVISEKVSEDMGNKKKRQSLDITRILSKLNRREQIRILGVIISETEDKPAIENEVNFLKDYRRKVKSMRKGKYGKRNTRA